MPLRRSQDRDGPTATRGAGLGPQTGGQGPPRPARPLSEPGWWPSPPLDPGAAHHPARPPPGRAVAQRAQQLPLWGVHVHPPSVPATNTRQAECLLISRPGLRPQGRPSGLRGRRCVLAQGASLWPPLPRRPPALGSRSRHPRPCRPPRPGFRTGASKRLFVRLKILTAERVRRREMPPLENKLLASTATRR